MLNANTLSSTHVDTRAQLRRVSRLDLLACETLPLISLEKTGEIVSVLNRKIGGSREERGRAHMRENNEL